MSSSRSTRLRTDIVAGLTTAAVVIPKTMAYAAIAGLPLQTGLYTALIPPVVYAAIGTSRPLSVTTTSTISILVAEAVARAGNPAQLMETASAWRPSCSSDSSPISSPLRY